MQEVPRLVRCGVARPVSCSHSHLRPRVLFLSHSSQLGGAEFVLLDLVTAFREQCAVHLFEDGPLRSRLEALGIPVLLPHRRNDLRRIKRDRSLLRALPSLGTLAGLALTLARATGPFDLLYANSQKSFVLAAAAVMLVRRPLVWHLHDILDPSHFGSLQRRLQPALANCIAARVIVPSQAVASSFIAAGGNSVRVRIAPNGIAEDQVIGAPPDREAERRALGLPSGFLFGVFSRLSPWKGQHVAIEALQHLPDMICVLAGSALFGEDRYAAELRQRAHDLGVASRVVFLGQRDDVSRLMRLVDVVVHPSIAPEPFGRTLVEAMLARRPVVATALGAVPEIVADGETGLLVPGGDSAALAQALQLLRANPALAADLGRQGERHARSAFPVERMLSTVDAVLAELLPKWTATRKPPFAGAARGTQPS